MHSAFRRLKLTTGQHQRMTSRQHSSTSTSASSRGVVVSRRLWLAHLRNNSSTKERADPSSKSTPDDKPWPISIVRASYVAAATLIPYFTTWFVVSNRTLRDKLNIGSENEKTSPWFQQRIRHHFGQADPDSSSYVDLLDGSSPLDHRFTQEESALERATDAHIQKLKEQDVLVRICHVDDGSTTSKEERTLPGSTLANEQALRSVLPSDDPGVSFLQFPNPPPSNLEVGETSNSSVEDLLLPNTDPLLQAVHTYSPWQYQNPDLVPGRQSNSEPAYSKDELEKSRLEYEIDRLETELKKGSTRSIDDIVQELETHRAELRNVTWKRWNPWS
jgi:hypothetical protein